MADLDLLQVRIVGALDRGFDHIRPRPRHYGDRSVAEVVHDNVTYPLVGACDAHRTHP